MNLLGKFFIWVSTLACNAVAADLPRSCGAEIAPVVRFESLFGKVYEVSGISHLADESPAFSDPSLKVVELPNLPSTTQPILGFGKPNVYLERVRRFPLI
jgi:hypothetical protein